MVQASEKKPESSLKKFQSFSQFYPYYLSEHSNMINRRLHFIGTTLVMILVLFVLIGGFNISNLGYAPICGYGFAWVGHFFFEQNKPATFKHPIYSFLGDFQMWYDIATGKIKTF